MKLGNVLGVFTNIEIQGFQDGQSPESQNSLLKLNHKASSEWTYLFNTHWNRDLVRISFNGDTMQVHCSPMNLKGYIEQINEVISVANKLYKMKIESERNKEEEERKKKENDQMAMEDLAKELGFK